MKYFFYVSKYDYILYELDQPRDLIWTFRKSKLVQDNDFKKVWKNQKDNFFSQLCGITDWKAAYVFSILP